MAPCNGAHDTGYVPAKSVRELLIFFETEAKRLQAGSGGGGKNGMSSPRAEPGTCCIASREESRAAQQARRRFRGHNRIAPMKNQGANAEKLQNVAATETQQQQQQQQDRQQAATRMASATENVAVPWRWVRQVRSVTRNLSHKSE
mmetsp:Transcript_9118/g.17424  ORF Transcript_9118/g.17424 Transcript_9118/m.17424 type:complete len:146 (+) Transcript_9118:73-510(+)